MYASIVRRLTMGAALVLCFGHLSGAAIADEPRRKEPGVISMTLVGALSDEHRAKILRAVNEWNVALNGKLHLELLADANQSPIWTIVAVTESSRHSGPQALGLALPFPNGGGVVLVHLDKIGRRDVGGVIRHELGHVLGLRLDGSQRLTAASYGARDHMCIDYPAMAQVAALHRLELGNLKWCGER